MCGGSAQTTQAVSIPPEVMQNYRAVNARANEVAATPFQQYSTDPNAFVAPINQAQQTGMNAISAAGGVAQPYFQGATQQLMGGQAAATPYYGEATQQLLGGLNAGVTGTQAAYQPLQQGAQAAQGLQGGAYNQYQNALQSSQPYNQAAGQYAQAGLGAATPYYGQAAQNITGAQDVGGALGGASLSSLQQAGQAAQPLQGDAAGNINSAASAAQPLNQAAIRSIMQGNRAAQPLQQQAAAGLGAAQAGAQPYQQLATNFGLSGSQAVNAGPLGGEQINQYMSPYLDSVVGSTMANLRQQQGQEQSSLVGNQVAQGAFGGDRGRLAQANLARQQNLATGQTVAGLMNQGYGQALGAAQQQQQLGLGAAQANRAAQQQASQQMLGIGQQGFGQGMATAQQQAALGQQLYGQGIGSGQALAGIGQQQYGQQMGTGQAQAALGSQLFGQGAQTAQQQAAMGQQLYGQGMGAASAQQGLGQGLYGMGTGMGGFMQGLGQQNYAQQSGTGQNLAQLGQQTFGQGAAQSGQQAALAQQQYGMGAGAAGQMAGLGQGLYGMGAGTSQALAGMGTQAQQNALAAGQAQLGAGTVAQQTQQAGQTALYNQFLQQQGFPYQQAQFLANIAMGTGALSGSTTTTNQPMSFFSDKRLKEAVEPIGKTFDGQKIVKFRYKNEPGTRIGLIAQDVEKHHPDAVGLAGGYKTVDYDAATKDAATKGHYARGGLAPESEGGAVLPAMMRHGFAEGGNPAQLIGNDQLAAILQAQFGMYNNQGIPGLGGSPGMTGFVPGGTLPVGNLTVAGAVPELPKSQASDAIKAAESAASAYKSGKEAYKDIKGLFNKEDDSPTSQASAPEDESSLTQEELDEKLGHYRGGLVGHYASGGASSGPYGIPISNAETPDLITAGDAPPRPKSQFETITDDIASVADLSGATTPKKAGGGPAEEDIGSGTPYASGSNPYMPDSTEGVEKGKELAKPGAAPDAPESGFSQIMHAGKNASKIAALAAAAAAMNRGGRTGYAEGGMFGNPAGDFDAEEERNKLLSQFNQEEQNTNPVLPVQRQAPVINNSRGVAPPLPKFATPTAPAAVMPKYNVQDYVDRGMLEKSRNAPGLAPPEPTMQSPVMPRVQGQYTMPTGRNPEGILNRFSDVYLRMGDAARQGSNNPDSSRVVKYGLAPAAAGLSYGLSAIPASINAALSKSGTPFYPQPLADAGKTYSFDTGSSAPAKPSPTPARASVSGNRTNRPVSTRPSAARTAAPGVAPRLSAGANMVARPAAVSQETGAGLIGPAENQRVLDMERMYEPENIGTLGGVAPSVTQPDAQTVASVMQPSASPAAAMPPAQSTGVVPPAPQQERPGFLERNLAPKGGYLDRLSQGDEDTVVSLLSGLGAMAGSSNRYGLGALAEGVGAGASSYQKAKQNILARQETGANIGQTLAGTGQVYAGAAQRDFYLDPTTGQPMVRLPGGRRVTRGQWVQMGKPPTMYQASGAEMANQEPYTATQPGTVQPSVQPSSVGVTNFFGDAGKESVLRDVRLMDQGTVSPDALKASQEMQNEIDELAKNSAANLQGTRNLGLAATKQEEGGLISPGPLADFTANIAGRLNNAIRIMFDPETASTLQISNNAIANKEVFDKLTRTTAFQNASANQQNSMQSLMTSLEAIANPRMTKRAAIEIITKQLVTDQRNIDEQAYLKNYQEYALSRDYGPNAYMAQHADASFRQDRPDANYIRDQKLIFDMTLSRPDLYQKFVSGEYSKKDIDQLFFQKFKVNNMGRYFVGGY